MNRKLNICLLNDAFPPAIDGVANVVLNYARNFTEKGINVTVGTPDYPNADDSQYDFRVLRYPSINTIDKIGYVTGVPFEIEYLSEYVNSDIDIIHTHCPMTSNYLARILRETIRKPIVFTYHTKYDIDIQRAIKNKLLQKAAIDAIVSNISACDEVWAVSSGAADNLRSLGYKGNIEIMENGVDMEKGKSAPSEIIEIRKEFDFEDGVPSYLFVGRMMWYKGIKIILDALKMLKDSNFKFKMLFVGDGVEFEEIVNYSDSLGLKDCVTFAGSLSNRKKLKQIFSSADVFLFPSTFDTNGLVVREAASSGLPSILIKGSCAAEGVNDGVNAILIDETAESLKNALIKYSIEEYREIGNRAMDELYISWADATEKAYKRYEYILENYKYKKINEPLEPLFSILSDASITLKNIESAKDEFDDFILEEKENLKEIRNEFRKDVKEILSEDLKEIKILTDEIKNKIKN